MKSELEQICDLVRACGQFIKDADRSQLHVDAKGGHANFVTEYDKQVQERLRVGLREIIIDGTTNFIKDYHFSSISVALVVDNAAELGVIYNPYTDEMFYAQRGEGAFCNGKRLHVSSEPLENAIIVFGTAPYHEELNEKTFSLAYSYFRKALDIRRSGSAALDLCTIAAGRAELFFELVLSPWDYAAGALIVEEAGGLVSDCDGRALAYDRPCSVLARNKTVQPVNP